MPIIPDEMPAGEDKDILSLLQKDEQNERALIKCLIEFGLKEWSEGVTVADYLIGEMEQHLVEELSLQQIMETYKTWYREGLRPTEKNFLYYEDQQMSAAVVALMDFPYELSPNWKEHYEGKMYTREELYREEILSTVSYLKLRKVRKMIEENQRDMNAIKSHEEWLVVAQTHQHLKQMEKELVTAMQTVIVK